MAKKTDNKSESSKIKEVNTGTSANNKKDAKPVSKKTSKKEMKNDTKKAPKRKNSSFKYLSGLLFRKMAIGAAETAPIYENPWLFL